ncbi:fumarylacetoacetate hydrolase family protein [Roseateles cellulosilyticus]|uniref:Fumarylacetoacetate hydrolase family protein n=1 Tax=Pelomonas cellulosilytica TaxID=2906762 RepID=A0ABS8XVH8_9BURK|nr:fumarylacetoacetate hydrolase family protein [Pelomonas sp. P8]MCE4556676.1 fumarylacetoacetate hydrolase family protein [Pelomonas sp. P8]
MPAPTLQALVTALADAHRHGTPLRSADWADTVGNEADAYAVQEGVAAALGWRLDRWKSGGASPQGPFSHSPVNPLADGRLLGVEAEVALRVGRDVTPAEALGPLSDVIDAMCIAVELVASRWTEGLDAPALLRMADHQSNAGLWLGPWQPWRALDWARLPWRLSLAGAPVLVRQGGHSLGDPAGVLPAWLRHATRDGRTVKAGTVVTTGAWGGLHAADAPQGSLQIDGLGTFSFGR